MKLREHQIETARRSNTCNLLTETHGILAIAVACVGWRRHSRMVGRDSVGRYRPLSMAFGLEELFDHITATASELRI